MTASDQDKTKLNISRPFAFFHLVCVLLLGGLTNCSHLDYCVDKTCFHSEEDALSYYRSIHADALARIEPLPSPIARAAIVVIPPIELHQRRIRTGAPNWNEKDVRGTARLSDASFVSVAELIEHRNIFASTEIVREIDAWDVTAPADGFITWLSFKREPLVLIRTEKQQTFTRLDIKETINMRNHAERGRYILKRIEDFVSLNTSGT